MTQNKITIGNTEYELESSNDDSVSSFVTPIIIFQGKRYIGKAIPNDPGKDYEIRRYEITEIGSNILSVKRLEDKEVFSIGDKLDFGERGIDTIKEIKLYGKYIWLYTNIVGTTLQNAKKYNQHIPLFTTDQVNEIKEIIRSVIHETHKSSK